MFIIFKRVAYHTPMISWRILLKHLLWPGYRCSYLLNFLPHEADIPTHDRAKNKLYFYSIMFILKNEVISELYAIFFLLWIKIHKKIKECVILLDIISTVVTAHFLLTILH